MRKRWEAWHERRPTPPDAELIALCERHRQIIAQQQVFQHADNEDEFDRLVSEGTGVLDEMAPIRARTFLGLQAKALALAADDPSMLKGSYHADIDLDLAASLIADLLGIELGDAAVIARLRAGEFRIRPGLATIEGVPA